MLYVTAKVSKVSKFITVVIGYSLMITTYGSFKVLYKLMQLVQKYCLIMLNVRPLMLETHFIILRHGVINKSLLHQNEVARSEENEIYITHVSYKINWILLLNLL